MHNDESQQLQLQVFIGIHWWTQAEEQRVTLFYLPLHTISKTLKLKFHSPQFE